MTSDSVHLGSDEGMLRQDGPILIRDSTTALRRICPGQHVANRSIFMNAALIFWAFRVSEDPKAPIDSFNFSDTVNQIAEPFRVIFEPRSSEAQIRHLCAVEGDDN